MGDPRNLSFSTTFNQPKILINSSQTVTIPTSGGGGLTPDVLFTVTTNSNKILTFRAFYEVSGVIYPIWRHPGTLPTPRVLKIAAGINSLNNFFIRTQNQDPPIANVTFYYRIYTDSEP